MMAYVPPNRFRQVRRGYHLLVALSLWATAHAAEPWPLLAPGGGDIDVGLQAGLAALAARPAPRAVICLRRRAIEAVDAPLLAAADALSARSEDPLLDCDPLTDLTVWQECILPMGTAPVDATALQRAIDDFLQCMGLDEALAIDMEVAVARHDWLKEGMLRVGTVDGSGFHPSGEACAIPDLDHLGLSDRIASLLLQATGADGAAAPTVAQLGRSIPDVATVATWNGDWAESQEGSWRQQVVWFKDRLEKDGCRTPTYGLALGRWIPGQELDAMAMAKGYKAFRGRGFAVALYRKYLAANQGHWRLAFLDPQPDSDAAAWKALLELLPTLPRHHLVYETALLRALDRVEPLSRNADAILAAWCQTFPRSSWPAFAAARVAERVVEHRELAGADAVVSEHLRHWARSLRTQLIRNFPDHVLAVHAAVDMAVAQGPVEDLVEALGLLWRRSSAARPLALMHWLMRNGEREPVDWQAVHRRGSVLIGESGLPPSHDAHQALAWFHRNQVTPGWQGPPPDDVPGVLAWMRAKFAWHHPHERWCLPASWTFAFRPQLEWFRSYTSWDRDRLGEARNLSCQVSYGGWDRASTTAQTMHGQCLQARWEAVWQAFNDTRDARSALALDEPFADELTVLIGVQFALETGDCPPEEIVPLCMSRGPVLGRFTDHGRWNFLFALLRRGYPVLAREMIHSGGSAGWLGPVAELYAALCLGDLEGAVMAAESTAKNTRASSGDRLEALCLLELCASQVGRKPPRIKDRDKLLADARVDETLRRLFPRCAAWDDPVQRQALLSDPDAARIGMFLAARFHHEGDRETALQWCQRCGQRTGLGPEWTGFFALLEACHRAGFPPRAVDERIVVARDSDASTP